MKTLVLPYTVTSSRGGRVGGTWETWWSGTISGAWSDDPDLPYGVWLSNHLPAPEHGSFPADKPEHLQSHWYTPEILRQFGKDLHLDDHGPVLSVGVVDFYAVLRFAQRFYERFRLKYSPGSLSNRTIHHDGLHRWAREIELPDDISLAVQIAAYGELKTQECRDVLRRRTTNERRRAQYALHA